MADHALPVRRPAERSEAAARGTAGSALDHSPRVRALGALSRTLNSGPRVIAQRALAAHLTRGAVQRAAVAPGANRTGLPDRLRHGTEALSGIAMDDVRVHRNSSRPAQLQAHAFAQGSDIHLAPGQEHHLPHEAWHVVQQKQGRVRATMQLKGGVRVNDHAGLEREADMMGARATALGGSGGRAPVENRIAGPVAPIQRVIEIEPEQAAGRLSDRGARKRGRSIAEDVPVEEQDKDKKVLEALEAEHATEGAAEWAYAQLHKGTAKTYSVEDSIAAAESELTPDSAMDDDAEPWPMEDQPSSLFGLHDLVANEVANYDEWLNDPATWEGRSERDKAQLPSARRLMSATKAVLAKAQRRYPLRTDPADKGKRGFKTSYDQQDGPGIAACIRKIRLALTQIDEFVTEPPVKPKQWTEFKGDIGKYEYADGVSKPIPVIFYKQETNYKPIVIPGGPANKSGAAPATYDFPNGPTVWRVNRPRMRYTLQVASASRFKKGDTLINSKKQEKRAVQIDINKALADAGVTMRGKDGDHVRDLGFGGADIPTNYWPLDSKINRRPFHGWRGSYGLNYVSDGQDKTASITALNGKHLEIKDFMAPGDGNVPAEGVEPAQSSGAIREKPQSATAAPSRETSPGKPGRAKRAKKPDEAPSRAPKPGKAKKPTLFTGKAGGKGKRGGGAGRAKQ